MRTPSPALVVTDSERAVLESLARAQTATHGEVSRARALLGAAEGRANTAMAADRPAWRIWDRPTVTNGGATWGCCRSRGVQPRARLDAGQLVLRLRARLPEELDRLGAVGLDTEAVAICVGTRPESALRWLRDGVPSR